MRYADIIMGIGLPVLGAIGIGYGVGSRRKTKNVEEKLNKAIRDLSDDIEIDISDKIVNAAIERAVDREVSFAVKRAANDIVRTEVNKSVSEERDYIKNEVLEQTKKAAAAIDVAKLQNEVRVAAKEKVLSKFDDDMNDILEKYNRDLDNVSKIYSSIAKTIADKNSSVGTTFTIS